MWIASAISFFLIAIILYGPVTEYNVKAKYIMTWQISPVSDLEKKRNANVFPPPKSDNKVELQFKNFPDYIDVYYADDLAAYLQKQTSKEIEVVYRLYYSYGKLSGFNTIQIGELTSWDPNAAGGIREKDPIIIEMGKPRSALTYPFPRQYWPWNKMKTSLQTNEK